MSSSYDALPYPSHPYPMTRPGHQAAVATLLGLHPPAPDRARVLELGCAGGGNLIPMAIASPNAHFLGIDLSSVQIEQGRRTIASLALTNIDLRHLSILDMDERFGSFDYILCHGVFSWVPERVQNKILDLCGRLLSPDGIAYVSYNTFPGWYMRGMIRDMMRYHVSRFHDPDPATQVRQARELLSFLASSALHENSPYTLQMRQELELLQQHSDSYLFHEHLEETNEPVYFLQFCERLRPYRLRYLGEADLPVMVPATSFAQEVQDKLDALAPDLLLTEQYMDFLRNRQFRQTLICHADRQPRYDLRGEALYPFRLASPLKPALMDADLTIEAPLEFKGPAGLNLTASTPIAKAAITCLGEVWPLSLPFDELLARARALLGPAAASSPEMMREEKHALARSLLSAYGSAGNRLLELSLTPPAYVGAVSARPVACPLARLQAAVGDGFRVTSRRHEVIAVTEFDRHLLALLDGSRDRDALLAGLADCVSQGSLTIQKDEQAVVEPTEVRTIVGTFLDQQLAWLAQCAILVG